MDFPPWAHSALPLPRKTFTDFRRHDLLSAEDAVSPTLVDNCFARLPQWEQYGARWAAEMCAAPETEGILAECAATDGLGGIAQPRYYGGEPFATNDQSLSPQASPATGTAAAAAPSPLYNTVGGIDCLDSEAYLVKNLLALKVEAIRTHKEHHSRQRQQRHLQQQQQSAAVAMEGYSPSPQLSEGVAPDTISSRGTTTATAALSQSGSSSDNPSRRGSHHHHRPASFSSTGVASGSLGRKSTGSRSHSGAALPALTLQEAREVLLARANCRSITLTATSTNSSSTTSDSPAQCSLLSGGSSSLEGGYTRLQAALIAEPGCLSVKAPLTACPELLRALHLDALTYSSPKHMAQSRQHEKEVVAGPSASARNGLATIPPGELSQPVMPTLAQHHHRRPLASTTATPREVEVRTLVSSPLLLEPGSLCAFLGLAEAGAGTRAHVNVKGSHAWHVLLSGRKGWIIVHPLDRHLVSDLAAGELADLFHVDDHRFPHARHARVYTVTQEAGETLFIPADAVYSEYAIPSPPTTTATGEHSHGTVSLTVYYMDASSRMAYLKHSRAYAILEYPCAKDSLAPETTHITTVDLVLFDDNVYQSFRGNARSYRPDDRVTPLALRGMTEFLNISVPSSELGARLELESLQSCFCFLGEALLNEYQPKRYVAGAPKGYLVSRADHRLILYYFVDPVSLAHIRECLASPHMQQRRHRHFQCYDCPSVTLPAIKLFRSTVSHQGRIPNYVPLSVLLNQVWSFERDLCRRVVSLPHIILDKASQPLGFVRPGSVWHYSRFDVAGQGGAAGAMAVTANTAACCPLRDPTAAAMVWANGDDSMCSDSFPGTAYFGCKPSGPEGDADLCTSTTTTTMDDKLADGWCRTYLFYCSPLLDRPVSMHPICNDGRLQTPATVATVVAEAGAARGYPAAADGARDGHDTTTATETPPAHYAPRILEFEWDADRLEEYGMVSLLQFRTDALAEIKHRILTDASFPAFEAFVRQHCLCAIDHSADANIEKVMSVVLWFLCRPRVVGFTFGGEDDPVAARQERLLHSGKRSVDTAHGSLDSNEPEATVNSAYAYLRDNSHIEVEEDTDYSYYGGGSPRPPSHAATRAASALPMSRGGTFVGSDGNTVPNSLLATGMATLDGSWAGGGNGGGGSARYDTVCLTASAASAFLRCVPDSSHAQVATRVCNWVCDLPAEAGAGAERNQPDLLATVRDIVMHGDAEKQAIVSEVIRIKRVGLEGGGGDPLSHNHNNQPPVAALPPAKFRLESAALTSAARLNKLEVFCHSVERQCDPIFSSREDIAYMAPAQQRHTGE